MPDNRLQTLSIYGKEFPIRTAEQAERVEEVASLVDQRMREVADTMAMKDPVRIAIMASLNIAGQARADREAREAAEQRLCALVARLERALESAPYTEPEA